VRYRLVFLFLNSRGSERCIEENPTSGGLLAVVARFGRQLAVYFVALRRAAISISSNGLLVYDGRIDARERAGSGIVTLLILRHFAFSRRSFSWYFIILGGILS